MHPTPSFPEHKSPGPPKIPSKWTQQHLSLLAGSNNRTTALRPLFLPCYIRNGTVCRETPGQEAKGWQCPAKPAMAWPGAWRAFRATAPCEPAGGRGSGAGTRGRRERAEEGRESRDGGPTYRSHGGSQEPTAACVLREGRGQLWGKLKVKVPEAEGEERAGQAGLRLQSGKAWRARCGARRRGRSHGKLAREARAGSPRRPRAAASRLVRRSGDPCRSRNWADRALSTELAGRGLCKMPARKVTPGYPLQICHVL